MWITKVIYSQDVVVNQWVYSQNWCTLFACKKKQKTNMQCCCMRILLAKMLYPGPCSLIQRHSCWLFNLSGTVCWNQCPARWLVSVLSLRLHSTHCASSLEGKITGSISVRTLWTSSATGWGRTKLGQPFPLQRTDYLVVCFCRFVILFFSVSSSLLWRYYCTIGI